MNTESQLTQLFGSLAISTKPVKKSWAMLAIEEEEEEKREKEQEITRKNQQQMKMRRELYAKGLYQLEEGEILE